MDMHHIRYFVALCDTLNFTRAAQRCNVTQPALSRAIRQLEGEVGGMLVRRERNLTHITDLGRLLEPQLRQTLMDADAAKALAARFLSLEAAEVALGVMYTIGPQPLLPTLTAFQSNYPGARVAIMAGSAEQLSHLLEAGLIDLAIMPRPEAASERLRSLTLYRERFCIACSANHPLASQTAVAPRALAGEAYLLRTGCAYSARLPDLLREQGVELKISHASECDDWIKTMAAAGLGLCLVPEFALLPHGLLAKPLTELELFRDVGLLTIEGRRFSPVVSLLLRALERYAPDRIATLSHGAVEANPVSI